MASRFRSGDPGTLRKAGLSRRVDAEALFAAGRYDGAAYLAGYKVEADLKVGLMALNKLRDLRALEAWLTQACGLEGRSVLHDLEKLSEHHRGVKDLLSRPRDPGHHDLLRARVERHRWSPDLRYAPPQLDRESARRRLDAVDRTCSFLQRCI
jgi:hypothetical protein